ncbi:hypothetical protein V1509DRAFT_636453 [Lipomyces kononenkoae]
MRLYVNSLDYANFSTLARGRNAVERPQGAGQIGNRVTLTCLGLSRERNITRAAKDIRSYLDSFAELLYLKAIDAEVRADDGTTVSLGYRSFCKPTFYSYEKWKHVPGGIQTRMCEFLELEFPLLSLAEGQWASVVFLSAYFRRAHCSIKDGSHSSAGYRVPIIDGSEDEGVEDEQLREEQREQTDGELSDVSQAEDGDVENRTV